MAEETILARISGADVARDRVAAPSRSDGGGLRSEAEKCRQRRGSKRSQSSFKSALQVTGHLLATYTGPLPLGWRRAVVSAGPARLISFYIPDDTELLAAFGAVSLQHSHLDYILRMTVKTLASMPFDEAIDATERMGSAELRDTILKLARKRLGHCPELLRLRALVERCRRATRKRNDFIHSVWGKELDGEPLMRFEDNTWRPLPTLDELRSLAQEIRDVRDELNEARLYGWLGAALAKSEKASAWLER